jgi:hypothetical protein
MFLGAGGTLGDFPPPIGSIAGMGSASCLVLNSYHHSLSVDGSLRPSFLSPHTSSSSR